MFGLPAETGWIWLGLLVGSAAMFGVVADLGAAPPDAARLATAIDEVAAGQHHASGSVDVDAESIRLRTDSVSLRGPGGSATETIEYGPVTPVASGSDLERVLEGQPPGSVFDSPAEFKSAIEDAAGAPGHWRPVETRVRFRRVRYGEVNCVLLGA